MNVVNGEAIANLRKQKGMDQKTLAEKANVNASVLSRLERNLQSDFHASIVVQIADVLEVSVDSILNRNYSQDENPTQIDWQLVIEEMQKQPLDIQKQAAYIMKGYLQTLKDDF